MAKRTIPERGGSRGAAPRAGRDGRERSRRDEGGEEDDRKRGKYKNRNQLDPTLVIGGGIAAALVIIVFIVMAVNRDTNTRPVQQQNNTVATIRQFAIQNADGTQRYVSEAEYREFQSKQEEVKAAKEEAKKNPAKKAATQPKTVVKNTSDDLAKELGLNLAPGTEEPETSAATASSASNSSSSSSSAQQPRALGLFSDNSGRAIGSGNETTSAASTAESAPNAADPANAANAEDGGAAPPKRTSILAPWRTNAGDGE